MDPEIKKLVISGVLGGIVATILKILADMYLARYKDKDEAYKKMLRYAKPLWLSCHELNIRLKSLVKKIDNKKYNPYDSNSLKYKLSREVQVDWFTKNGYYITSTAYLISLVASWITLFERDVVFLEFSKKSTTADFFRCIENFKQSISADTSALWYHYLEGIGSKLILENGERPMTIADFSFNLYSDKEFRSYYDQVFQFLYQVGNGEQRDVLQRTVTAVDGIMKNLEKQGIVPNLVSDNQIK